MLSRERVIETINHRKPDRVPVYGWLGNLNEKITGKFGSIPAFEDHYEFDFAHLFGGPGTYDPEGQKSLVAGLGRLPEPPEMLDVPMMDPNNMADYQGIDDAIRHHKQGRGRFVYM